MKNALKILLIVSLIILLLISGTVIIAMLSEKPLGDPDKVKYCYYTVDLNSGITYENVISKVEKKVRNIRLYSLQNVEVWARKSDDIEIINLYYYCEEEKYKKIKVHITVDSDLRSNIEYIAYYKDTEYNFGSEKYKSGNELNNNIITENYCEVKEKFFSGNDSKEYFINMYNGGNMYVMQFDGGGKLMRVDVKVDCVWEKEYDRDNNLGYLSHPFPNKD